MKKGIFIFLISLSICGFAEGWMEAQIEEDLAPLIEHPMDTKQLKGGFKKLSKKEGAQAAYFKIRGNKVKWKKTTPIKNEHRMGKVFEYLKGLSSKYTLPDVDLILSTHDAEDTEYSFPVFSFAKKKGVKNIVLFPDLESFSAGTKEEDTARELSKSYPWEKKKPLAFFRGATTGVCDPLVENYGNDRAKVVAFSHTHPDLVDATFSYLVQHPKRILDEISSWLFSMNKKLDTRPVCDHYEYKYLLDIDGNSCTYPRCKWILYSNSALVKVMTDNIQWFYGAMEGGTHFIPVKRDLSDFEKTLKRLKENDEKAHQIAKNGQILAQEIFSEKAVDTYVVTLLNRYAKYMSVK